MGLWTTAHNTQNALIKLSSLAGFIVSFRS